MVRCHKRNLCNQAKLTRREGQSPPQQQRCNSPTPAMAMDDPNRQFLASPRRFVLFGPLGLGAVEVMVTKKRTTAGTTESS
mmetsp:Transcript_11101/g.24856  ORF Transcript_11101/g.24856 Transcript_11101/m.24856 type:complete len:81 (+) Transcript_11101:1087-1329(+)